MNILFTTYQGGIAGATYSISYLAKGLAERGHRVVVAGKTGSLLFELLQNTSVELIGLPFRSKVDRHTIRRLRDIIVSSNIELVNAQSSYDRYLTIFARWYYRLNVKVVHTRRNGPKSLGGWLHNTFYIRGTDKIVVTSNEQKKIFIELGYPEHHLYVIHNGTPAENYRTDESQVAMLRDRFGIGPDDVVIGCVARLKQQDQLVAALPYLDPAIKVLFVGIEPGSLDEVVAQHAVTNPIIYAGDLDRAAAIASYRLMNAHVLPSDEEGFGLVVIEAMGTGTPSIGTNSGGIKDIVRDGENGLLFTNRDAKNLAKKIRQALYDEPLRAKLIANGRKTALQEFSIEKTVAHYEAFFQELING